MIKEKKTVVFIDSGKGGLPYFHTFKKRQPDIHSVYVADKEHFPYGEKTKKELVVILIDLVKRIISGYKPDIIVLACNTASVSALDELRKAFNDIIFVGTVPAVRPAALESRSNHIGVLGTERTIEDHYIDGLAKNTGKNCKITKIAAPELVEFVENHFDSAGAQEKKEIVGRYIKEFRDKGADAIVLGCTHFLFLLDEFKEAALPDIKIFDSIEGVCGRIETILRESNQ